MTELVRSAVRRSTGGLPPRHLESILLQVQKPGRFVGGELNAIVKPWDLVSFRTALVFPDI